MRSSARFLLVPAAAGLLLAAGCGESSSITSPRGATAQSGTPAPTPTPPAAAVTTTTTPKTTTPAPATTVATRGYPSLEALVDGINATADASPAAVVELFRNAFHAESDIARRMITASVDMIDVLAQLEAGVRTHLGDDAANELMEMSGDTPGGLSIEAKQVRIESRTDTTAVLLDDVSGETMPAVVHNGRWFLDADTFMEDDMEGAEFALGMFEAMFAGIKAAVGPALAALESGEITTLEQLQSRMNEAARGNGAMDEMMEGIGEALVEGMQEAFEGMEEGFEGLNDVDTAVEPVDAEPLRPFAERMVELIDGSSFTFSNGNVCIIETATLDLDSFEEAEADLASGYGSFMIDCTVRVTPKGGTPGDVQEWSFMLNTGWNDGTNEWSDQPRGWHKNGCSWGFSPDGFPDDLSRIDTVSNWLEELSDEVHATDG